MTFEEWLKEDGYFGAMQGKDVIDFARLAWNRAIKETNDEYEK